jgi:indole-3-glycerol phosphate synthase
MADFLDILVKDALKTVQSGYYEIEVEDELAKKKTSLKDAIAKCKHAPVIAEIKPASPSYGSLRNITHLQDVAQAMEAGGAVGISVLTEPKHFKGSVTSLIHVKRHVGLPVLMKDIIVDPVQIEAAAKLGVDAVLLIYSVFERGYVSYSVKEMIQLAKFRDFEVLLETHTKEEFLAALSTSADLVGINNRDLKTLKVDLHTTERILRDVENNGKIVVSESGIQNPQDIRFLRKCGAKAFLVGSAIMLTQNIEEKVRELVMTI